MKVKNESRWMLVDDNEDILFLMREIVSHFTGAQIECFNSPLAALVAYGAAPGNYELVITDFEMPGMNGVEFCHRILAIAPRAKILLATGSGLVSAAAAEREGFSGLLQKPFPFAALQKILNALGLGNDFAEPALAA
ncbi:MAG TPA: response regulator [Verrucomicrobiae bacterium]|nr:response regulator [Verrucomicrobiae bacterium]